MLSRRAFVGKLAAGTAVACAAGIGGAQAVSAREGPLTSSGTESEERPRTARDEVAALVVPDASATLSAPPAWELVRPLGLGTVVARGWRVKELTGVVDGSCVLTLENERGRAHRVHLCGNDGRPTGLVYTDQVDLVVMNGGQGDLPTDEGFAQAVAEVAHVVAANERELQHQALLAALLPHAERVRQFEGTTHARLR